MLHKGAVMTLKIIFAISLLGVLALSMPTHAQTPETQGLILKEMAALDKAFKTSIDAVIFDQLERIAPAYEEVHKVREDVEGALKQKKQIILPRNQKLFKRFVSLDNKFHREIEILVQASKKDNIVVAQQQINKMLKLCIQCHRIFRKQD